MVGEIRKEAGEDRDMIGRFRSYGDRKEELGLRFLELWRGEILEF